MSAWSSSTRPSGSSVNVDDGGLGWGGTSRNAPSTDLGTSLRSPPTTLVPTSAPWRPVHPAGSGWNESASALTTHVSGWGSGPRRPWMNSYGDSYGEDGSGARFAASPNRRLDSLAPVWNHFGPPQIRVNDVPADDGFSLSVPTSPVPAPRPDTVLRERENLAPGSVWASTASPREDDSSPRASELPGGETAAWYEPKKAEEEEFAAKPNRHDDDVETRLAQVTGLAAELQRRLLLLEEAVYSRDRELAELRAALQGRERRDEQELATLSSSFGQASSRATMGTPSLLGAGAWSLIEFTPPSSPERQRTRVGTRSRSADSSSFDRVQLDSRFSVSPRSSYGGLLEAPVEVDAEARVKHLVTYNEQQESLILQQKVATGTADEEQAIFAAVGSHLRTLACSRFGNFLVSRCIELGAASLAHTYTEKLRGSFLAICLDPFGCHVVQKLVDCGGDLIKQAILEELLPHRETLLSRNACHVWNRILAMSNLPSLFQHLVQLGAGSWSAIVQDDGGSLIAQRILQQGNRACTSPLVHEIIDALEELSKFNSGCFVLSHLIEQEACDVGAKIMHRAVDFAQHSQAARLVDKCIRSGRAEPAALRTFVESVISSPDPLLVNITRHATGAQLVLTLLTGTALDAPNRGRLAAVVHVHEQELLRDAGPQVGKVVAYAKRVLRRRLGGE
ncbi:ARM repeat-containing protein [Rhodotorula sp. JG-1b]|nr:ARM repeat-containing protein [Rhodotorula sp. JG-1b]